MWLFLVTVPYWVNLLIRTVSMKFLIRDNGPLNEALLGLGVISEPIALINTDFAVQLGLFYSYLPFMVLPIYASVERYDFALSEAAADLYANRWTTLRKVTFPIEPPASSLHPVLVRLGPSSARLLGSAKNFLIGSLARNIQGLCRQRPLARTIDDPALSRAHRAPHLRAPAGAA